MASPEPEEIEVKLAFHPGDTAKAISALRLNGQPKEEKQIHFFDTRDLACFGKGLIMRARQTVSGDDRDREKERDKGKGKDDERDKDDLTLKLRGSTSSAAAARFAGTSGSKFEGDKNVGNAPNPSFSITVTKKRGSKTVDSVANGEKPFESAMDPEAQQIMREAMHPSIQARDLVALGPITSQSWKLEPEGFDSKITAELWRVDGTQLLELSEKVPKSEVREIEEKFKDLLKRTGLRQLAESKTKFALKKLT